MWIGFRFWVSDSPMSMRSGSLGAGRCRCAFELSGKTDWILTKVRSERGELVFCEDRQRASFRLLSEESAGFYRTLSVIGADPCKQPRMKMLARCVLIYRNGVGAKSPKLAVTVSV